MFTEHIEKLKREFTDQYVVVDEKSPELKRFTGHTGFVKTVNMSGRALVEFIHLDSNIGWYDIDVDFLKIVDEPLPEDTAKTKETTAKPAAKKAAESKPPSSGEMSVADILAAARGGGADPAAKAPSAAQPDTTPAAKKMSVEEMLAAARSEKSATESPPAAAQPAAPKPVSDKPAEPAPTTEALPSTPADIVAWCRQRDGS